ncbi:MAG: TonB-dependent receptor [Deltaproteobacteria bacterium]
MQIRRIIFLILLFSYTLSAQDSKVFGVVRESISKDPLEMVTIYIEGTTNAVYTDANGYYTINVPSNRSFNLLYSRLGFKKTTFHFEEIKKGENHQINVFMAPEDSKYEVIITESRVADIGMVRESMEELKLLPITSGNFESVLPSIALGTSSGTGGELSSQYNVRGGNYDENMVYVNDFEVYRPQLIQNSEQEGLSFPNSDLINNLSFSSGGFEPQYGDKMSSVLDIKYKRPTVRNNSLSVSMLGISTHMEASLKAGRNKWNKLNILAGLRYKDNRYLLASQNKKGEYQPSFTDLQTYITYNITKDLQIAYLGNYNSNIFRLIPLSSQEVTGTINTAIRFTTYFEGNEIDKFNNGMNGIALNYVPDRKKNPLYLKLLGSAYIGYENQNYDIIGQYRLSQIETDFGKDDTGKEIQLLGIGTQHKYTRDLLYSEIYNLKHLGGVELGKTEISGIESSHFLQWGLEMQSMNFIDKINEWERLDSMDYSLPYTDSEISLYYVLKSRNELSKENYSAFFSDTYYRNSSLFELKTTGGLRMTYLSYNDEMLISPRLQVSVKPNKWKRDFAFKLAGGIYYQPPFYKEHRKPDGSLNLDLKSQRSYQLLGGMTYDFYWRKISDKKMRLITEVYFKKLENMVSYDYDNVRIIYSGRNNSSGYITGIDLRINGEFVPDAESWINISLMQAREKLDGVQHKKWVDTLLVDTKFVPLPTDRLANVAFFFQDYFRNNKNFKVHFALNVGTGLPFGFKGDNVELRNNFRFSPYRRVDVGFSYLIWDKTRKSSSPLHPLRFCKNAWVSFEIFNILGINNQSSVNWVRTITGGHYAIKNTLTSRRLNLRFKIEF